MHLSEQFKFSLLIGCTLLLTILLYFNGLGGPLLYDDIINFGNILAIDQIDSWAQAFELFFTNTSGPFGRSVSQATFVIQKYFDLFETFHLKTFNLIIHLINGLLIYFFLTKLLQLRKDTKKDAEILGFLTACFWLLHPLHISTILYTVQRMTQLATLFSLLSLYYFVLFLPKVSNSKKLTEFLLPSIIIALFISVAVFAKENAILVFPILLLISYFFISPKKVPKQFNIWILLIAGIPTLIALYQFSIYVLYADYTFKGFNFAQRGLTQSRVVVDYISQIVIPNTNKMTLFHDDFMLSNSLFNPISTLLAFLFISTLLVISFIKKIPIVIRFGLLWFFIWHLIESTVLPLYIFFEHRNYLPSIGLILALIQTLTLVCKQFKLSQKLRAIIVVSYTLFLSISTFNLANIWSNEETLYTHWLENHPLSTSTLVTYSQYSATKYGVAVSTKILDAALKYPEYKNNISVHLYKWLYQCISQTPTYLTEQDLAKITNSKENFHTSVITAIENIVMNIHNGHCRPQKTKGLNNSFKHILLNAPQRNNYKWLASIHLYFANYLLSQDAHLEALTQFTKAHKLQPDYDKMIPIIDINIILGNYNQAHKLLAKLQKSNVRNPQVVNNLKKLKFKLEQLKRE